MVNEAYNAGLDSANISKEELEELTKFQSIAEFKKLHNQTEQSKKDMEELELESKLMNKDVLTHSNTFLVALISFVLYLVFI